MSDITVQFSAKKVKWNSSCRVKNKKAGLVESEASSYLSVFVGVNLSAHTRTSDYSKDIDCSLEKSSRRVFSAVLSLEEMLMLTFRSLASAVDTSRVCAAPERRLVQ